jgi:hypothetical protein
MFHIMKQATLYRNFNFNFWHCRHNTFEHAFVLVLEKTASHNTVSSKCVVLVWTFLEYKYHKYFCVHHRHWWHIVDTVSLIWCCANLWHLKCCSALPIIRFVGDQPEGVLNFTMCPYVHTSRIWFRSVTLWQIIWNV